MEATGTEPLTYQWSKDDSEIDGATDSTLSIESPQDNMRTKLKVRSWACKGEAPAPFDACLELRKGNRKLRLSWSTPQTRSPLRWP